MRAWIAFTLLVLGSQGLADTVPDPKVLLGRVSRERAAQLPPVDVSEIRQMEADFHYGRRTFGDVLRWGASRRGKSRGLVLVYLARDAFDRAYSTGAVPDPGAKIARLDAGIEVQNRVLATAPDLLEAMLFKAVLLNEKARNTFGDPRKKAELSDESVRLTMAADAIFRKPHPSLKDE